MTAPPTARAGRCTPPGRRCAPNSLASPTSSASSRGKPNPSTRMPALVRGARYRGKARVLRRLQVGVLSSLEVEDASPTSAALAELERWSSALLEKEAARAEARRARSLENEGRVPRWVGRGMGARLERAGQGGHRGRRPLGGFRGKGVLPLEFKPAHSLGELLTQHLDDLEQEADAKGGVAQLLRAHFARVYKVTLPRAA